jgi:hypothetical protein
MLERLYERSMGQDDDRQAIRVLSRTLLAVTAALAGLLLLPMDQVVQGRGTVVPAEVTQLRATDDCWVRLDDDYEGQRVQEGQVLGTRLGELDTERVRHELRQRQEELLLLKQGQLVAGSDWTRPRQEPRDTQASTQRIALLEREVAWMEQQRQPEALRASHAGVVLSVGARSGSYTWMPKGALIAEYFSEDALVVRAGVPAHKVAEVSGAEDVILENERTGDRFHGRVKRVFYTEVDQGARLEARVDIVTDEQPLKPGLPLKVSIITQVKPLASLLRDVFFGQTE